MANNWKPSFNEERQLNALGYRFIAGVDEAGRGALFGPVVAAAVILPFNLRTGWQDEIRESKQLNPKIREILFSRIQEAALSVGIGVSSHEVIDAKGIVEATRMAMKMAIGMLAPEPQYLLIDYIHLPGLSVSQKGITKGDALCFSIACASIVAKVTRDRMIVEMDGVYPGYGLARHKGYGTREHLACLRQNGPCPVHRRSFRPVSEVLNQI